jgi:hypothetical protein
MSTRWLFSLGERHNSGLKKLSDVHLTLFFGLVILLNVKKFAKKWEKFTNFLKPQNKQKKPWWVGVCLETVVDLVYKIANELLFSTCVAVHLAIEK